MKLIGKLFIPVLFFSVFLLFPKDIYSSTEIVGSWASTTNLPYHIASHASISMQDTLLVIGGSAATGNGHFDVIKPITSSSGEINSWSNTLNLPTAPIYHMSVSSNSNVYVVGGFEENPGSSMGFVSKVFLGKVGASGDIENWSTLNPLPTPIAQGNAAIVGDYLYVIGGRNNGGVMQSTYYAPINPDGSIGTWELSTFSFPGQLVSSGVVAHNNTIYIIGGVVNGSVVDKVYKTYVNTVTGEISDWEEEVSLPHPYNSTNQTILVGDTIIVVGGGDSVGPLSTVYYSTINPDGTLQPWQLSSNNLPKPIAGGSVAYLNGYLYIMGGYSGGYLNDVYYSKLNIDLPPSEISLNVPSFMQTDSAWGNHIYDSAHIWSPTSPGISAWGCAMTSAAMVFNYHKITKLPNNLDLNPGNLNAWLKAQPDGYVGSGWVNWLALSRLSKQAKSKNPLFTYDALEFKRVNGYNPIQLKTDLENNIPGILEVPGHFVVGKGTLGSSFTINDPYYSDRPTLSSYSNSFLTLNRFVPSNTDLSYLMFLVDDGIEISVKDENGDVVGEGFIQQPLDEDGGIKKSGNPMYMYYVAQPESGDYTIEISGNKPYSLQTFFYDVNGEVKKQTANGVVTTDEKDSYIASFNKQSASSSTSKEEVSFDNLLLDLEYFYSVKKLKNRGIYMALSEKVKQAKYFSTKNKKVAKQIMDSFLSQLDGNRKSEVTEDAYQILKSQGQALYKSL